jgi:hypothetical protein
MAGGLGCRHAGARDAGTSDAGPPTIAAGGRGGRGGQGRMAALMQRAMAIGRMPWCTRALRLPDRMARPFPLVPAGLKGIGGTAGIVKAPDGNAGSAAENSPCHDRPSGTKQLRQADDDWNIR